MTEPRHRRRRLLYLVGVIPSLLLLLLSARIAVLLHDQSAGLAAYEAGRFTEARGHFADNRVLNPIQRWIAPFDEGDARYRLDDFEGAVSAFTAALELVPDEHECLVRVNLALAYEALGDAAVTEAGGEVGGDVGGEDPTEAWRAGRKVLAPCLPPGTAVQARDQGQDQGQNQDPTQDQGRRHDRQRNGADPAGPDRRDPESRRNRDRALDGRSSGAMTEAERTELAALRTDRRLARRLGASDTVRPPSAQQPPPQDDSDRAKEEELRRRNEQAHADHVEHHDDFDRQPSPSPTPSPVPQW